MSLVTLREVLAFAQERRSAIPAFTVDTLEVAEEIAAAAEAADYPAILMIGQNTFKYGSLAHMANICKDVADSVRAPLVLHLDHGKDYEQVIACLRNGFTSVMFDGSKLPLEENIAVTKEVSRAAHAVGVDVEAELGAIGGTEDGQTATANLVDVGEARRFLEQVEIEALAIGIGNAHGIYKSTPNLAFDRLEQVAALGAPPLVLHGGSGIPDEMIQKAILLGIRKINVATEVRHAFMEGIEAAVGTRDIYQMYASGRQAARAIIEQKTRLFNTAGLGGNGERAAT